MSADSFHLFDARWPRVGRRAVLSRLCASFLVALFYLIKKFTIGVGVAGFTTLVVSIFFLAGIQLMTIGVIGEYIGRISDEVKHRPLYVARRVTRR